MKKSIVIDFFIANLSMFENDSDEIVIAALKLAKDRNKVSWGYTKGILNTWLQTNLNSIDQVKFLNYN